MRRASAVVDVACSSIQALLNAALACHRCETVVRTLPQLKAHIASCRTDIAALEKKRAAKPVMTSAGAGAGGGEKSEKKG